MVYVSGDQIKSHCTAIMCHGTMNKRTFEKQILQYSCLYFPFLINVSCFSQAWNRETPGCKPTNLSQ